MDSTQQPVRHLSVCSGFEGIGLGLRRVFPGLREIAYIEIEAFAIANLVSKAEEGKLDSAPIYTDVKSFPFRQFRGKVDILSGGFPCQPFSTAGSRQGTDDERHLYPFISTGIRACQPTVVFLENVPGIITTKLPDGTPVLQHVLQDLEVMGYTATAGIFSAEETGAPHVRDRVFILGRTLDDARSTESHRLPSEWGEKNSPSGGASQQRWPARFGKQQYEWEASRTLKPRLGRAVDGIASGVDPTLHRMDRLRMIGNGAVPHVVEKSYRVLAERLREES
jgi:DNA (cytosine-5)-methyltransferase 1